MSSKMAMLSKLCQIDSSPADSSKKTVKSSKLRQRDPSSVPFLCDINDTPEKIPKNQAEAKQILAFWRPTDANGYLGQWFTSDFVLTKQIYDAFPNEIKNLPLYKEKIHVLEWLSEHEKFDTAEKFMMMGKAALFNCRVTFNKMSATNDPRAQKQLGRRVTKFDDATWNKYCCDIVSIGNYLKFTQDPALANELKSTGDAILVEGSPLDKIWGVGLKFDDPRVMNQASWQGTNYLGNCLMFVRDLL